MRGAERDSGRLAARPTRLIGRRLSPAPWDFGPPARSRKGLLMMAMPHWPKATWRAPDSLISTRTLASTCHSFTLCCPAAVGASTMAPGPSVATLGGETPLCVAANRFDGV